jgi:glycosyltransferase involved in cell wall biosynthesis
MTFPLVSLCIPTFNGAATLGETLDSIVAQAFDGLEVVICDDASRDGTVALAEDYARRFIHALARHAGKRSLDQFLKHAKGVARLAADWPRHHQRLLAIQFGVGNRVENLPTMGDDGEADAPAWVGPVFGVLVLSKRERGRQDHTQRDNRRLHAILP